MKSQKITLNKMEDIWETANAAKFSLQESQMERDRVLFEEIIAETF